MMPRVGDRIIVMPYGAGVVNKLIGEAQIEVALERIIKKKDGSLSNIVIAELHPCWFVVGTK